MNLRNKVFGIAAASIFALSLGGSALAGTTTGEVNQKIATNEESADTLSAWLEGGAMREFTFSNTGDISYGSLTLGVKDERGSNAGWNVKLQVDPFEWTDEGQVVTGLVTDDIDSSGFHIYESRTLTSNPGSTANIGAVSTSPGLKDEQVVLSAARGAGTGKYFQPYGVSLAIPALQAPGTYTADVTVTIASAPGELGQ